MSGVEVLGIGLAILPILISAAEHYDDCLRPILRYRKIVTEIQLFQRNIQVQKAIFRNQCRLLLESAIEHDAANRMLGIGANDPSWVDQELEASLLRQLGSSKDACLTSIELIDEKLQDIAKKSLDMHALVDEKQCVKHRLAKKLRFSLSQTRLDEHIRALRDLNDDFTKLSNQTSAVAIHQVRNPNARSRLHEKEVSRYRAVGEASEKIYEVLGNACTKHTEHLAHFCIIPVTDRAGQTADTNFKFHIAFTRLPLMAESRPKPKSGDSRPLWFMIDAVIEQDSSDKLTVLPCGESVHSTLMNRLKREFEQPEGIATIPKKSQKSVRFQTPETAEPAASSNLSSRLALSRFRRNFCDILKSSLASPCSPVACIGLLENAGNSKHRVYPPSEEVLHNSNNQTTLLSVLTSSGSKSGVTSGLLTYEKLHLAKNLAVAVLQYHATPWMGISWRSRDIYLLSKNNGKGGSQNLNLSSLHVNVKVKGRHAYPGFICTEASTQSLAPNTLLFSLGVTLLELAYSSDIQTLQQLGDFSDGRDSQYTEFFAAKRLASNAIREMGGTYSKVVKQLLQCNFGCGDDLKDPDLQVLFYKDIVCELDRLEQDFRKLALG